MNEPNPIWSLVGHLLLLALLAIGGLNTILPELHRVTVLSGGWMSDREFTTIFALANAAPGPNMLFITLLGWKLAGIGGALLSTLAFCGPTFVLAYGMGRVWTAWGARNWFWTLQRGLAPVTIGLIVASAWLLTDAAASSWRSYIVTALAATAMLVLRIHPLWILATAGLAGIAGLV